MVDLIEQHRDKLADLCRAFGVKRLEIFGSGARGDFDAQSSDLDFFVEFQDLGWKGSFRRYMGLKLGMEELFGRPVDLVEPEAVTNPYFIQIANQHRAFVYAA